MCTLMIILYIYQNCDLLINESHSKRSLKEWKVAHMIHELINHLFANIPVKLNLNYTEIYYCMLFFCKKGKTFIILTVLKPCF